MVRSHCLGRDVCVVGPKGQGKSELAREFGRLLGYDQGGRTELICCYKDMSPRDLLMHRSTSEESGDTEWAPSALVHAARGGGLAAVLDGVHRLTDDTLGVLASLCSDREAQLFDGTRLVAHHRFDRLVADMVAGEGVAEGMTEAVAAERLERDLGLLRVHESFRMLALAESPKTNERHRWLQSETLPLFAFQVLPDISLVDKVKFVTDGMTAESMTPSTHRAQQVLGRLAERLESTSAGTNDADSNDQLSLRQIKRVWEGLGADTARAEFNLAPWDAAHAEEEVRRRIWLTQLADFSPKAIQDGLTAALDHACNNAAAVVSLPEPTTESTVGNTVETSADGLRVRIGSTELPIRAPARPELVPDPYPFFDVPAHVGYLENMARDLVDRVGGSSPLLLIGDQGTGKNKLTDRLLQLLGLEREYMQLHRDSTVQSLTVVPTLTDGKLEWVDSPLVNAVKYGRVAVIDEADKAPTETVVVLKSLVEDGSMLLSDGRRIVSPKPGISTNPDDILVHPDFKMIVLANRPGFPFLGNDFFREVE